MLRFQKDLRPHLSFSPVHTTTPYLFENAVVPSMRMVAHGQMNSTHAHFNVSVREIGAKMKLQGSACPPFWILTVEWF